MSDPKQPSNPSNDIRQRLGIGGAPPFQSGDGNVPPPAFGGGAVPPPAFGGGGMVPPTGLGLRPSADVAPPSFLQKKKKKREKVIREVIEEVYIDAEPVVDKKGIARRRKMIITCSLIAVPMLLAGFYIGNSRQNWALMDRSRADAATLTEKLTKAAPVIQDVQAKTSAALNKANSDQIDDEYITYTQNMAKQRPINNSDLDMLNYAAFSPETVDGLYEFNRLVELIWSEMTSHRNATRQDLDALSNLGFMGAKASQTLYGVALTNLYEDVYGANIGLISNPGQDEEGHKTLDIQVRTGRKSHPYKLYTKGAFGEKVSNLVIPIDPALSAPGGPLVGADDSHMTEYTKRLSHIRDLTQKTLQLHSELLGRLQSING
jgi:hypothetical protein